MSSPHRKPLGRGAALTIAWAGMVATLLLVVAFVAWVNARISPPPITPRAVQAAPQAQLEPEPDALWEVERAERIFTRRWTR